IALQREFPLPKSLDVALTVNLSRYPLWQLVLVLVSVWFVL
ncbi:hypothetical protein M5D96_004329, partial [Drosophila gunungcola]